VANSIGPIVEIGNGIKEIDFGQVEVLREYTQKISIRNKSKIEADFHAFTRNRESVFRPVKKHWVLQPNESFEQEVVCCADDISKFNDILHFVIKEGLDIDIVLKAKGVGSTCYCKEDLNNVNFGVQFTSTSIVKEIFVENKGRKQQKLTWAKRKPNKKTAEDLPLPTNKKGEPIVEPEIFSIIPESVVLPPKHGIMFQFKALSLKRGKQLDHFLLNSQIGNERKINTLFNTQIEGDFCLPMLAFSEKKLHFKYVWEKD